MNTPLVKLGDVCEVVYGFPFNAEKFNVEGRGLPLIRIRNVLAGHSETFTDEPCPSQYHIHAGDILVGMDGDFNIAKWRSGEAVLNQRVCKLVPKESRILPGYLFHRMKQVLTAIWEKKNFVTVKHLLARDLDAVAFPLPSLAEQERIVAHLERTLGAIDAMEAKFREMAETAERHFRATLDESFAALSSTPAAKLGDVCEVRAGANQRAVEDPNGAFPIYGSGGKIGYANAWRCPANTVLVGRKGTLNNPMLIPEPLWNIDTAFGLIAFEKVLPAFLHRFCQSVDFEKLVPDSGRPSTTATSIRNLDLPLPSLAEQERVVARLERAEGVSRRVVALAQEGVAQCGVYRRAVLSEAFGGGEGGGDE